MCYVDVILEAIPETTRGKEESSAICLTNSTMMILAKVERISGNNNANLEFNFIGAVVVSCNGY